MSIIPPVPYNMSVIAAIENQPTIDRPALKAAMEAYIGYAPKPLNWAMTGALMALLGYLPHPKEVVAEKTKAFLTLQHTGKLVKDLQPKKIEALELQLKNRFSFKTEGLFDVLLSWENNRLLNVGFFVDDQKNLVIANSQRDKLDQTYRSEAWGKEKKTSDNVIRMIKDKTGLTIESFGTLAAIFYLTQKLNLDLPTWSQKILFVAFEDRPAVKELRETIKDFVPNTSAVQNYFANEIAKKRHQMDFETILGQIGLNDFQKEGRFISLPLNTIQRAFESKFTDDEAYPDRYIYRRLLSTLLRE